MSRVIPFHYFSPHADPSYVALHHIQNSLDRAVFFFIFQARPCLASVGCKYSMKNARVVACARVKVFDFHQRVWHWSSL